MKLIPIEIVTAYVSIEGLADGQPEHRQKILIWSAVILFILIPFHLRILSKVQSIGQMLVTMLSFAFWVFSLGGPFLGEDWYERIFGAVGLILWTLIVPLFPYQPSAEDEPSGGASSPSPEP